MATTRMVSSFAVGRCLTVSRVKIDDDQPFLIYGIEEWSFSLVEEIFAMPRTRPFYSVNEIKKAVQNRVFHNNDACPPGQEIPPWDRRPGTNDYRECDVCEGRNKNWDTLPPGAVRDLLG